MDGCIRFAREPSVQTLVSAEDGCPACGSSLAAVWNLNYRTFQDFHKEETAIFGVLNPDWSPRSIYVRLAQMQK